MKRKPVLYKSFTFRERNPLLDVAFRARERAKMSRGTASERSGVAKGTFRNWDRRKTRSPNSETIMAAIFAIPGGAQELVAFIREHEKKIAPKLKSVA